MRHINNLMQALQYNIKKGKHELAKYFQQIQIHREVVKIGQFKKCKYK